MKYRVTRVVRERSLDGSTFITAETIRGRSKINLEISIPNRESDNEKLARSLLDKELENYKKREESNNTSIVPGDLL